MERRVVVTGMGAVTPIGNCLKDFWQGIREGRNGIDVITHFDLSGHKATMGAEVKNFEYEDKRAARRLDRISQMGITAALEAVNDSGLRTGENVDPYRTGVIAATGIGGIMTVESEVRKAEVKGLSRVSPVLVPMIIPNLVAGNIAIKTGAKGNAMSLATACSSGTNAIGEAARMIKHGYLDTVIAGGAEAGFAPVCFAGFVNMTAISLKTDRNRCCIPFDKERDGFVMGEGAAFMILEEYEHAKARGAKIYGEIAGYGATCDAYHITLPEPGGEGAARAMKDAIEDAGISPADIDYINAHGTGTPANDATETRAIKKVFGEHTDVMISSTKSMTGHLLGAAGAVEAIACIKAMEDSFVPPTINLRVPDPELDLDYVPNEGRNRELKYTLSESLGFGGHNAVLVFKKA
ncbi:MAG: beta-ketoacyl-ACP synthase II [Clostridia bacterium]|nr:beta-ketoacyl-ACP synthase II [Clostridia bacterium]